MALTSHCVYFYVIIHFGEADAIFSKQVVWWVPFRAHINHLTTLIFQQEPRGQYQQEDSYDAY